MHTMRSFLTFVLALAHFVTSAPSRRSSVAASSPPNFEILSISPSGILCPANSVRHVLSEDKKTLKVTYTDFNDYTYPDMFRPMVIRGCVLDIIYSIPRGYVFTIPTVSYNAYYSLDPGVSVSHDTVYYFENNRAMNSTANGVVTGPMEAGVYDRQFKFLSKSVKDRAFTSPCSAGVGESYGKISSTMTIMNSGTPKEGYGRVGNDEHPELTQIFNLGFEQCLT